MGGRIEDALSAGEDFVDELYLPQAFDVFVFDEATEALAVGLEAALGRCV